MFTVIATIRISPDRTAEWEDIFARRREQVLRDEAYTLRYDMVRSIADPCEYVVIEGFADEHGHDRHLRDSIGHEAMMACFAGPPSVVKTWPVPGCAADAPMR